jgi:uncharacterized protein YlxW (UPF0749 family)
MNAHSRPGATPPSVHHPKRADVPNQGERQPTHRFDPAALLAELVANPLDAGYRAAAERNEGKPKQHWFDRPLVAVGCVLIGFLAVVAYVHTNRGAPQALKVHDDLVNRVRTAEHSTNDLAARLTKLQAEVARVQNAALSNSGPLAAQLRNAEVEAGQIAVQGPGVTVTLREPKLAKPTSVTGRPGSIPISATNILSDRDVRSVVNELWHDGAEAVAVNGVRLTPDSAIRFAGDAVLVDFQPITSPYRVRAIGNSDTLSTNFAQSGTASRYQTLQSVDHIGFSVSEDNKLDLPAGAPAVVRHASIPTTKRRGHHK